MRRSVEERSGHPGRRHLRALRGDGSRRQPGVGGDPGRPARLGGPLPARGRGPGDPRGAARRRGGRAGVHQPHQAGDAGGALPHPGPDQAAARYGVPRLPADAEGDRAHRRHDDRARRERVPLPGRGADPHRRGADAALPVRADPARQPRRARPSRSSAPSDAAQDTEALGAALRARIKQRIGVTPRSRCSPRTHWNDRSARRSGSAIGDLASSPAGAEAQQRRRRLAGRLAGHRGERVGRCLSAATSRVPRRQHLAGDVVGDQRRARTPRVRAPACSQAALIPTASSPERTETRPSSHAESTTIDGVRGSWSMS